jgi:hypothetical protein
LKSPIMSSDSDSRPTKEVKPPIMSSDSDSRPTKEVKSPIMRSDSNFLHSPKIATGPAAGKLKLLAGMTLGATVDLGVLTDMKTKMQQKLEFFEREAAKRKSPIRLLIQVLAAPE